MPASSARNASASKPRSASTSMSGAQQSQQFARVVGLPGGGWAEHGAQHRPGAGLDQGHQLDHRVAGGAERGPKLAQPGPVAGGVGHLERHAAVERHGAVAAEPHSRGRRQRHRPGQHLEQRPQRCGTDPTTQIPKRLARRRYSARRGGGELGPHPAVAQPRKQAQRQHEVHPHPRRQIAQPALHGPRLGQHRIDQLDRNLPGQLAQMARSEHRGTA